MGNEDESIGNSNSSDDTVVASPEKDEEEAREELPSVAPKDPNHDIPNGGFKAWLQVLGSFLLFFNSWFVFPYITWRSHVSTVLISFCSI
jgi:hypothetical protein